MTRLQKLLLAGTCVYLTTATAVSYGVSLYWSSPRAGLGVFLALIALAVDWVLRLPRAALGLGAAPQLPDMLLAPADASASERRDARVVRFVCVSDTHDRCHLDKLPDTSWVPDGDVLLHAGDLTYNGELGELRRANDWLGALPHETKLVMAGNHDLVFDVDLYARDWKQWHKSDMLGELGVQNAHDLAAEVLSNATYLQHDLYVHEASGLRVYAAPELPDVPKYKMAFCRDPSGEELDEAYAKVPDDVDVLLTHGPPKGVLDRVFLGMHVGSEALTRHVLERIKPRFHVFGHIHESYGVEVRESTTFINAAVCTLMYKPDNKPIVFDLPYRT